MFYDVCIIMFYYVCIGMLFNTLFNKYSATNWHAIVK